MLRPFRGAHAEIADGYARLAASLPPPERRGVVLIDPPFEAEDEFEKAARGPSAAVADELVRKILAATGNFVDV